MKYEMRKRNEWEKVETKKIDGPTIYLSLQITCDNFMHGWWQNNDLRECESHTWGSVSPIRSDSLWIVTFSVFVTGSPYDGYWVS